MIFDDDSIQAAADAFDPEEIILAFVISFAGLGLVLWIFA